MARLGMAQHFIASSTRRSSSIQSASRISLTALNEFSYVDNDNCRRNEHCLRAQRTENARARERRDRPPKTVFRNPAFDDVVSHYGNLRVDDDRQYDGRKAVNDRRQIRACHSQLGLQVSRIQRCEHPNRPDRHCNNVQPDNCPGNAGVCGQLRNVVPRWKPRARANGVKTGTTEDMQQQTRNRAVCLEVIDRATEVALERGNQERSSNACDGGRQQEQPKIVEQSAAQMMRNVQFNPLRDERALKGIGCPGNERNNPEKGKRYSDAARANTCNSHGIGQCCNHVDYKCKTADEQKLAVHASAARVVGTRVYPIQVPTRWCLVNQPRDRDWLAAVFRG